MENYETIVAVLGIVGAAWAKVRAFERSIIDRVEKRIDEAFDEMESKLDNKADRVAAVRIEKSVEGLSATMVDFVRRQDDHVKTLYDQDHAQDQQITEIRVELAGKADR